MKPVQQAVLLVGSGAALGSIIGMATNQPCTGDAGRPAGFDELFCGPRMGALLGGSTGVVVAGGAGLALAAAIPKYRQAGLIAAGLTAGLLLLGKLTSASSTPAGQAAPRV